MTSSYRQAVQHLEHGLCLYAEALAALRIVGDHLDRIEEAQCAAEDLPRNPAGSRVPTDAAAQPEEVQEPVQEKCHLELAKTPIPGVPHIDACLDEVLRVNRTEERFPFNLDIKDRRLTAALSAALTGPSIYLLQYRSHIVYVGKYQPITKSVVKDRWWRHIQTITLRGSSVGLGGVGDPEARLARLLERVEDTDLRALLIETLALDRCRFRDTGVNTSVKRAAFASKNWPTFAAANDTTILDGFSFHLFKLGGLTEQADASARVSDLESTLLRRIFPRCNDEFDPQAHEYLQNDYTLASVKQHLISAAEEMGFSFQHTVLLR